jgi:hypothetical protein
VVPLLTEQSPGHFAACHHAARLRLAGAFEQAEAAQSSPLLRTIEGRGFVS